MRQTKTSAYLLRALSNMHVGSGDNNYGIVDKQVQRDVIDPFPTIHSSGLKGAFRELFENGGTDVDTTHNIFGTAKDKSGKGTTQSGNYHFFNAKLIGLPVRSNQHPFYIATSNELLKDMAYQLKIFQYPKANEVAEAVKFLDTNTSDKTEALKPLHFGSEIDLVLEDYKAESVNLPVSSEFVLLQKLIGQRIALFNHADLKRIASDLPIIARNNLENGESVNLWYEEVVPRESRFYFLIKYYHNEDASNLFDTEMTKYKNICQVGGNASVGYGYNKISSFKNL